MYLNTLKAYKSLSQGELYSRMMNGLADMHKDVEHSEESKRRQTNPVQVSKKMEEIESLNHRPMSFMSAASKV